MNTFNTDETRCDHCGYPTPRLTPYRDIELCDECWDAIEPCDREKGDDDGVEYADPRDARDERGW
jgi:hypothetical protein